jgi:hypothetical protein
MWLDITETSNFRRHQLAEAGLGEITSKRSHDAIYLVIQEKQRIWKLDVLTDSIVEQCVIKAKEDESSSNLFESDSNSERINPLHDSE